MSDGLDLSQTTTTPRAPLFKAVLIRQTDNYIDRPFGKNSEAQILCKNLEHLSNPYDIIFMSIIVIMMSAIHEISILEDDM